jgi:hypothetical protein
VPDKVPTLMESIGDLQRLQMTWEKPAVPRSRHLVVKSSAVTSGVVDGHITKGKLHDLRIRALCLTRLTEWAPGERSRAPSAQLRAARQAARSLVFAEPSILRKNFDWGSTSPSAGTPTTGLRPDRCALEQAVHPTEPRTFTYREAMRIQGFPDDWRLWPLRDYKRLYLVPGKGVPVDSSRWFGHWLSESFAGRPGSMRGVPDSDRDREYILQADKGYKIAQKRGGYRVHELMRLEGIAA